MLVREAVTNYCPFFLEMQEVNFFTHIQFVKMKFNDKYFSKEKYLIQKYK